MITVKETVETRLDPASTFAYLSAFEHTPEWDPGTPVSTKMTSGPVGVGTRYEVQAEFRGKRSRLEYVVTDLDESRIVLRGENKRVVSVDTIGVQPRIGGGSTVTYLAQFSLKGIARLAEPFFASTFQKLGKPAADGMKHRLDDLVA